jgi:hypothetical protein
MIVAEHAIRVLPDLATRASHTDLLPFQLIIYMRAREDMAPGKREGAVPDVALTAAWCQGLDTAGTAGDGMATSITHVTLGCTLGSSISVLLFAGGRPE